MSCVIVCLQVAGDAGPGVSKDAFLAHWRHLCRQDPRTAVQQILYLGYDLAEFVPDVPGKQAWRAGAS